MNVIVKDHSTRKEYKFKIEPSRLIIELKELVSKRLGNEVADLKFAYRGIYLDDEQTISTYNLLENEIIVMVRKFIPIQKEETNEAKALNILVKIGSQSLNLEINLDEKVMALYTLVAQKLGADINKLVLMYGGYILKKERTISSYPIINNSSLSGFVRNNINQGEEDKIEEEKSKYQNEEKVELAKEFEEKDDVGSVKINVKDLKDKIYKLEINLNQIGEKLYTIIAEKVDAKAENILLIFKGKLIKKHQALSLYKIENDSTLYVVSKKNEPLDKIQIEKEEKEEKIEQNTLKINLATPFRNLSIYINPALLVIALKKLVAKELGDEIKIEDLKLLLSGKFLDNETTISSYSIKERDTILVIGSEQIETKGEDIKTNFVKIRVFTENEYFQIQINSNIILKELLMLVAGKIKIEESELILKYKGQILNEKMTISFYGIKTDDILDIVLRKNLEGKVESQLQANSIKIKVWLLGKVEFFIESNPNILIKDLKKLIAEQNGCNNEYLKVSLNKNFIDEERTFLSYQINGEESFFVREFKSFHVFSPEKENPIQSQIRIHVLTTNNLCFTFFININQFVFELKRMIEKNLGINISNQKLFYKNSPLNNDLALCSYQIKENDYIYLILNLRSYTSEIKFVNDDFKIQVKPLFGKKFNFNLNSNLLVMELKALISHKIGLEVENQVLYSHGKILKDQLKLSYYSFYANDLILMDKSHIKGIDILEYSSMKIILTTINGDIYFLDFIPDQLIKDLKKLIAQKTSIDFELLTLDFNGIYLDNELMLSSYYVVEDDHIKLIVKSGINEVKKENVSQVTEKDLYS